ncbi:ERBB receptor feedback inhibitor 1 isoform X2 [Protopterus annectens]|uniref:ERBB receptor feedback inhibitor 1 isoform X2 n=1 Tax=Protopterus annectens TaxID=7888 RepID=UPI001CFB4D05|nr:ERBB receptor feedback inhibitor 1 isoform X2 [Protopterus annectens]
MPQSLIKSTTANRNCCTGHSAKTTHKMSRPSPLVMPVTDHHHHVRNHEGDQVVPSFRRLSVNGGSLYEKTPPHTPAKCGLPHFQSVPSGDRGSKPLPPLPVCEDQLTEDVDSEVEFFTSSETDGLLQDSRPLAFKYGLPGRRSFRGCGQTNYAYFEGASECKTEEDCTPVQHSEPVQIPVPPHKERSHCRLRRSHSGPAGSYHKAAFRLSCHLNRAPVDCNSEKPEVPPRIPIPPKPAKIDCRRWSAEVAATSYSDEDKPPKVPPREPVSRSNSRTPSPKSLPTYLNGIMPPTQSFAPDPKYVSSKIFQRQNSEGSTTRTPCILPIIENGKKASSTHYYLLPERPAYLDRYEKLFRELDESGEGTESSTDGKDQSWCNDSSTTSAVTRTDSKTKADGLNHIKRKHQPYVVSP